MKKPRVRIFVAPQRTKRNHSPWKVVVGRLRHSEHRTQAAAVKTAVTVARLHRDRGGLAQLFIKRPDGRIRDERTYGADPRHIKG